MLQSKKLLIIGHVWPEPKSSAAGSRMMQLIKFFLEANFKITFACVSVKNENAEDLLKLGVEEVSIKLNHSSFDDFVSELQPSVVIFDRFMSEEQFGWRITENCSQALKILNTEDLHSLRKGREEALKAKAEFNKTFLFNDLAKREIASIYRCDLSLIISQAEMEILKVDFKVPESLLHYLPFLIDPITEIGENDFPEFYKRNHFITIGNFLHKPNYDAVLYLKTSIWPLIRKQLPNAELHIYGAYVPEKAKQLNNINEGFVIKGFADNVNQVMQQARVCLAPLRFGAGLKGKLIDAMLNKTPCVMSSIAEEGMFGSFKPNGFIADIPQEFANKAVELYTNEQIWNSSQKFGFEVLKTRFNKGQYEDDFLNKIQQTQSQFHELRQANFIGQMLYHHTMQGTKYMSKWIEQKNSTKG